MGEKNEMYVLHFVSSSVVIRYLHNFLFILHNFLFILHNFLFTGIMLYLRRLLRPLDPILAHPISQCLHTHSQ